ncbi:MAG: ParB/RepB/Spo0J family partition protein [Treponema sp.]|uniref:ParB/RepB/Spo0J family partition protein n=1 Tax=Treponema sp. TaxID=166 RepID=UPI003FA32B0A
MPRPALGRGLDSLIPSGTGELMLDTNIQSDTENGNNAASEAVYAGGTLAASSPAPIPQELDPRLLKPNPFQPRRIFNEESLQELAASIKDHGIIQPIIVEKNGNEYYIIAGERRTRAAILAGLSRVPVIFREFDNSKKLEIALIENIQRENLNPIEEAKAYQEIMQLSGLNQEETAKRVGKSRSAVANAMRLLQLPDGMQAALEKGFLSAGHARAILSLVNPADQQILFTRITEQGLSVREAEMQAAQLKNGKRTEQKQPAQSAKPPADDDSRFVIKDMEQQFIDALGTKVEIKGDLEKGIVYISYFSRADLDTLYDKLIAK